jgi:serine/threonine protein phosphatase 1
MASIFNRLFRPGGARRQPCVPPGSRVYAIGDVHGRLDLLAELAEAIEHDDAASTAAQTTVVMLGDLVDRGPDSAGVIDFASKWAMLRDIRFIAGNHEEMFLNAFTEHGRFRGFLRFGGIETLASYGLDAAEMMDMDFPEIVHRMKRAVPKEDRQFMRSFENSILMGDYLFVHAGINPAAPLDQQHPHDCRWIREPFLSHKGDPGCMVVHGHTVTEQAELRDHRIGIDTGAYKSGLLTALRLEGTDRRLIQTEERDGTIRVRECDANRPEDLEHLEDVMPGSL